MRTSVKTLIVIAVVLTSLGASLAFAYYSDIPSVHQQGDVSFVTGGIGDEERAALEGMRSNFNLRVTSAGTRGQFAGDTALTIYDQSGNEVVSANAGPLFYAQLPAGKYTIAAENNGVVQKKNVKVPNSGSSNLSLLWNIDQ